MSLPADQAALAAARRLSRDRRSGEDKEDLLTIIICICFSQMHAG